MKRALLLASVIALRTFAYDALQGPTELLYWKPCRKQKQKAEKKA